MGILSDFVVATEDELRHARNVLSGLRDICIQAVSTTKDLFLHGGL
jgi:hypothetical protein